MTEEEINKLQFTIRKKKNEILRRHLGEESLPEKKQYIKRAIDLAETYTNNFYNSEDKND